MALLAVAATAQGAPAPKGLWATVNICDTAAHPNQMGVRASMPGNHTRQRMFMRFHAQFYKPASKQWADLSGAGVTDWIAAGSARRKRRQAGYNFQIKPPLNGGTYVLRGVVDFQWRAKRRNRRGKVRLVPVRTLHANTKGDHPAPAADPPGYSSGTCEIR